MDRLLIDQLKWLCCGPVIHYQIATVRKLLLSGRRRDISYFGYLVGRLQNYDFFKIIILSRIIELCCRVFLLIRSGSV